MLGLTVLVCPAGVTKLSEYPEKLCRPEERQYAEPPSWGFAEEPIPAWCTEVGGNGCGRWTVPGCSEVAEKKFLHKSQCCLYKHEISDSFLDSGVNTHFGFSRVFTLGDRSRRVGAV